MKILQAVSTAHANGAVRYARTIIPELQARGHEVVLAALPDSWIVRQLRGSVEVIETRMERWPPHRLRPWARWFHARKLDLLHSHLTRANNFGALLHAGFGIPNIAHAHENKPHPHYWFHNRVVAVSQYTLRRHRRYGAACGQRGAVLPNFVDTTLFQPARPGRPDRLRQELGLDPATPVLLQVGDVSPRKGQSTTVAALPKIWDAMPTVHMVFIGRGQPPAQPADPRLHWLGPREDVPEILPHATAALQPSNVEPFGLAAIEAMACGVPLIASNIQGLAEIIAGGMAVPLKPGDADSLAEAALTLLQFPDRRSRLAARALQQVRQTYSLSTHMNQLLRHYAAVTADYR